MRADGTETSARCEVDVDTCEFSEGAHGGAPPRPRYRIPRPLEEERHVRTSSRCDARQRAVGHAPVHALRLSASQRLGLPPRPGNRHRSGARVPRGEEPRASERPPHHALPPAAALERAGPRAASRRQPVREGRQAVAARRCVAHVQRRDARRGGRAADHGQAPLRARARIARPNARRRLWADPPRAHGTQVDQRQTIACAAAPAGLRDPRDAGLLRSRITSGSCRAA